jgi:2-methylisocitrate lyase-like PEP mutase family enzyme
VPSLRPLLDTGGLIVAPGAYDGLTARLAGQWGFPAVYMTGAGTAAAAGYPDYGLLTMTEMAANAARLVEAVDVPVIADADTGYGNELNVVRAVRAFAAAGVAAMHIEDQAFPKRCGHLAGKQIVEAGEWLRKLRAAVEGRPSKDLMVIARTDARAVAGFDEAIRRARAALEVGADMVFVEAPESLEEVEAVPGLVGGPCLFNDVPGGRTPEVSLGQLERWGYRVVICPLVLVEPVVAACEGALAGLAARAGLRPPPDPQPAAAGPAALFQKVGSSEWEALRMRFGPDTPG